MFISKSRKVRAIPGEETFIKDVFICFKRENTAVAAFEALLAMKASIDISSNIIYSINTPNDEHGYYVYVDNNAMLIGVSLTKDKHMQTKIQTLVDYFNDDSSTDCYLPEGISVIKRTPPRKMIPLFSLSLPNDECLLDTTIKRMGMPEDGQYRFIGNNNAPIYVLFQNKRVIFKS